MIAVADSGSTKTDWIVFDADGHTKRVQTSGLNPYFTDEHSMQDILEKDLLPFIDPKSVKDVYFYGAGCAAQEKSTMVSNAISVFFENANCSVYTDLDGVLNAIDAPNKGIAVILGTGANSCLFSNTKAIKQAPSLGFILGDEGSGAYIGKMFIKAYLSGELPENIMQSFEKKHFLSREIILENVYRKPFPNRYLASFCNWIGENLNEIMIEKMVLDAFHAFFLNYIKIYPEYRNLPIYCYGSIAHYFSRQLQFVAFQHQTNITEIELSPIEGLMKFHQKDL